MSKKKTQAKKSIGPAVVSCLVVGLLVAGGIQARVDQQFLDSWAYVKATVEGLLTQDSSSRLPSLEELQAKDSDVVGGTGESFSTRNLTGLYDLTLKDSDDSEDQYKWTQRQISGTIGTSSSTFLSIQNTTGHDVHVETAGIRLFTNASSTTRLAMGTSTVTGNAYNLAWASVPKQIFGGVVATSTGDSAGFMATTTAGSTYALVDEAGTATTGRSPWVVVKPNEYIVGFMQSQDPKWATTSTNDRGFSASSFYLLNIREIATST